MAWTVLAVARRKDLCRLGGPHCCGVDGARYRSPEGSLAPELMGRTVHKVVFKDMIGQYGDGARFFASFFSHHRRLVTRFARKNIDIHNFK